MDIYQLKTFIAVAREGSITRASGVLHLSQPAVSAHIKAMEDALGVSLFERTPRGMTLTGDGQRLLTKAERTLAAYHELVTEAARGKAQLTGRLSIGAGSSSNHAAVGRLLTALAAHHPDVEVVLRHRPSHEVVAGIRNGTLDAGFYNQPGEPASDLSVIDVDSFAIYLVAAPGLLPDADEPDWTAIAALPWVYPTESACCSRAAERLFSVHGFRPPRIIGSDRQEVTRTLIASGLGVGLLHADAADSAARGGEVRLLCEADPCVRVVFAHLASRAGDPLLAAAASILRG